MGKQLQGVTKGLRFYLENSDTFVDYIVGTAAPIGTGEQASAPIGSLYQRIGTAGLYEKQTNVGNAGDWILNGSGSSSATPVFSDRVVRAATGNVVSAGVVNPSTFSDNDDGLVGTDYAVGEYLLGGVGGTPILFEVTAVTSATSITVAAAAAPLTDNDGLIVRTYHPDPAGQENTVGVMYQDGNIIKLFDVDWSVATAISLSSGYSPVNGVVTIGDSVEVAIEKLAGNQDDIQTLTGMSQGSTTLGAFTGATIPDNQTIKPALQAMETAFEETDANVDDLITLSGVAENAVNNGAMDSGTVLSDNATTNALLKEADAELTRQKGKSSALAVTSVVVLDSVLVDNVANAEWLITLEKVADPSNKRHLVVFAGHNGHSGADATVVDDTETSKLKQGSNFNYTVNVALNGAAAAQVMRVEVGSGEAAGINVYAKRIETLY